jgi:hypothetical protein
VVSVVNQKVGTSLFQISLSEEKPAYIDLMLLAGEGQHPEGLTPRSNDLPQIQVRKGNMVAVITEEVSLD